MPSTRPERQEFAACYEGYFWRRGFVPLSVQELNGEWGTKFSEELWKESLSNPSLIEYFEKRGVDNPYAPRPVLTEKQNDFLRVLFDPTDPSPLAAKMKKAKVSNTEYSAWMRDPTFENLMREEADKRFEYTYADVLGSLGREASRGNVQAIKLYLTLTGRYSEAQPGVSVTINQDLRLLTQKLLEILQRHVDPQTLALVHGEMEAVLFPNLPTTPVRRVIGAVEAPKVPEKDVFIHEDELAL